MHDMHMMMGAACCSSGHSTEWVSYFGLGLSMLFGAFHASRMFQKTCRQSEDACHLFMYAGMAYMFLPNPELHVIPNMLWALMFSVTALLSAINLVKAQKASISGVLHTLMNLAMVSMFVELPGAEFSNSLWNLFYAVFIGFYGLQLFKQPALQTDAGNRFSPQLVYNVSNIVMAALMLAMASTPMCMHMG